MCLGYILNGHIVGSCSKAVSIIRVVRPDGLKNPFIPLIELDLDKPQESDTAALEAYFLEFLKPSISTYIHLGEIMSFM